MPTASRPDDPPFLTVVMPVRDEERYIERSLGSVLGQDYPAARFEVLVADGRSRDRTRELTRVLGRGRDVRVIENPAGVVAPGLNAAIGAARGEIIVRVDGHCEIAPDYLRRAVELLRDGNHDGKLAGVGGPIETVGETPLARLIAAVMSSRFGVGGAAFRTGVEESVEADTVPFPAYPRTILEQAGPFDEELVRNQDDEYNYRLRRAGYRLLLSPDLRSRYYSRANLRSLWRQYFQYGFYKVRVMQKHPRQMRARQFVPALFVAVLAAGLLLTPFNLVGRVLLVASGGLYLLASLGASVQAGKDVATRLWPLLPVAFAIVHLAYGSGFWWGLVRFAGRFREDGGTSS